MLLSDKYPFLANYFEEIINSKDKTIPQSIVFYGNDLESQHILANEIARLINCKENREDQCECLNCKWIKAQTHPAVLTISRLDNKPDDDDSKTVISLKQSSMIKESLMTASEFHKVFIFCDKDDNGNILGLNTTNFQAETANSLLKIIEEPQPGVTFIFLTRYIDDLLSTIISRSQCFFVPSEPTIDYDYSAIVGIFENYWEMNRKDVFIISQKLQDLSKEIPAQTILNHIQNYILQVLKTNTQNINLIQHIKIIEQAKLQEDLGIKSANIFDNICLQLIK